MSTVSMPELLRRWLGRLGYALFLLACLEVALQGWYRFHAGAFLFERAAIPIFVSDPHRGWAVKPALDFTHSTNEFSARLITNDVGFRVSERRETFSREKPPGTFRVMLLGPSFAFGWAASFEDTIAAHLERLLEEHDAGGGDVEVVNAGVPSLPPANNLRWFRAVGAGYRPDLVVQLVHANLVVSGIGYPGSPVTPHGYLVPHDAGWRYRARAYAKKLGIVFYSWSVYASLRGAYEKERLAAASPQVPRDPLDRPGVRHAERFYESLREAVEGAGARLLVVWFPPAYAIHPEDIGRWLHDGVWEPARLVAFHDAFCRQLDASGIPCLDLYPVLAADVSRHGKRLYYRVDTHWTPRGNRIAAERVVERIVESAR